MFCPDCGVDLPDTDRFCQDCGYPADALRLCLEKEHSASIGWAERIIGKKHLEETQPVRDEQFDSFVDIDDSELEAEPETSRLTCETCGAKVNFGTLCENCGDKLPSLGASDNYFAAVMSGFFRFLIAPAYFARTLPFPITGGILQALLIPAILTGLYILFLPTARIAFESHGQGGFSRTGLAFIGMTIYILLVPIILLFTAALNHFIARLLAGHAPFRRTVRVTGSGLAVLMVISLVINILTIIMYTIQPELIIPVFAQYASAEPHNIGAVRLVVFSVVVIAGWYHAWLMAGLHRFSWWKTVIHTLATYVTFIWWIWLIVLFGIPVLVTR